MRSFEKLLPGLLFLLAVVLVRLALVDNQQVRAGSGLQTVPVCVCDTSRPINITTATTTELVPLVAGRSVRVCALLEESMGTVQATWVYGTGVNCSAGQTPLTGPLFLTTGEAHFPGSGVGALFRTPPGNALCIVTTGAGNLHGWVTYAQF
jgi:hypothetical protein